MFKRSFAKVKSFLFDDGEYVAEKQTEILQSTFFIFRKLRLSPQPGKTLGFKDVIVFFLIFPPVIVIDSICNMIYQYLHPEALVIDDMLQNTVIVICGLNLYNVLGYCAYKSQDILEMIRQLGDFHEFDKPVSFDRANRLANLVTIIQCTYNSLGIWIYTYISYVTRHVCLEENQQLNIERVCGMIGPTIFPEHVNDSPILLWIVVIAHFINVHNAFFGAAVIFTFTMGIVLVLASRVRHLRREIEITFECPDDAERKALLKKCVRYHMFLLDAADRLNDCVSWPCFLQAGGIGITIAIIAIQFLLRPEFRACLHLIGWCMVLVFYCYAGQILIDETEKIPMYIYDTNWFDYDLETQKFVLLIILRGNQHLYVDTLMFGPLALTTFTAVMQNSYSIIAMIF